MNNDQKPKSEFQADAKTEESVYERNEVLANRMSFFLISGLFVTFLLLFLIYSAEESKYPDYNYMPGLVLTGFSFIIFLFSILFILPERIRKGYVKYCLFFASELSIQLFVCVYGYNFTALAFAIPVLISNRYSSRKYQITVSVASVIIALAAPLVSMLAGQLFKYTFFDHNTLNFFEGTVITTGDSFYYSLLEHFNEIDWYYTYLDTFLEVSVGSAFLMALFVIINGLIMNRHRNSLSEKETMIRQEARTQESLSLAREVQKSALPGDGTVIPEKLEIRGKIISSEYVSGDFYDYFPVGEHKFCILIGDVSDHGLAPAMFMMSARNTLRTLCEILDSPKEIVSRANRILCERNDAAMFVTLWLGIIDIETGNVTYVNAGHPFPVLKTASGPVFEKESPISIPVGAFPDAGYEESSFRLSENDLLLLYTDGITEAENKAGEFFGKERLLESIKNAGASSSDIPGHIEGILKNYTESDTFRDDVTLLECIYKG